MINLFFWTVAIIVVRHQIVRDCNDTYDRNLKLFGYWINIEAGSTKPNCPNPEP